MRTNETLVDKEKKYVIRSKRNESSYDSESYSINIIGWDTVTHHFTVLNILFLKLHIPAHKQRVETAIYKEKLSRGPVLLLESINVSLAVNKLCIQPAFHPAGSH